MRNKNKAAFFDRDGTLIQDVPYLSRLEDVHLIPQALTLARQCQERGYLLFVITNQSGIARGYFDELFVHTTHRYLAALFQQQGVTITQFYACPHHPTQAVLEWYRRDCSCRKPKPGMLLAAAREYDIDLTYSLMFGDKQTDLDAGRIVGCKVFNITELFALSPFKYATLW